MVENSLKQSLIVPTNNTIIYLDTPFNNSKKDIVIKSVIGYCNSYDLKENHSAEGGFELPLTEEWMNANLKNKNLLYYHSARQLRFYSKDGHTITGLRLKDGINYMTDEEISMIKNCVEHAVQLL